MTHGFFKSTLVLLLFVSVSLMAQARKPATIDSISVDSTRIHRPPEQPRDTEPGWLDKNAPYLLGPLVGSLLAGLIAVYSVRATHARSVTRDSIGAEQLKQERQSRYCSLLFSIHAILRTHDQLSAPQRKELVAIRDLTLQNRKLVVEGLNTKVPVALLEKCLLKVLDYEAFDTRLIANIITYQHSTSNFNANLDFAQILRLQGRIEDSDQFLNAVESYFDQLIIALDRASGNRVLLLARIEAELQRFPFVRIVKSEEESLDAHFS